MQHIVLFISLMFVVLAIDVIIVECCYSCCTNKLIIVICILLTCSALFDLAYFICLCHNSQ